MSSARLRGDRQLSITRWGASPRRLVEAGVTGGVEAMWTENGIIWGIQDVSRRVSENNNENILIYVTFGSSISDKMYNYIRARAEF